MRHTHAYTCSWTVCSLTHRSGVQKGGTMVVRLRGDRRMYRAVVGVESKASDTPMVKRVMMAEGRVGGGG